MFRFNAALSVSLGLARPFSVPTKYVLTDPVCYGFAKDMRKWTRPAKQTGRTVRTSLCKLLRGDGLAISQQNKCVFCCLL